MITDISMFERPSSKRDADKTTPPPEAGATVSLEELFEGDLHGVALRRVKDEMAVLRSALRREMSATLTPSAYRPGLTPAAYRRRRAVSDAIAVAEAVVDRVWEERNAT